MEIIQAGLEPLGLGLGCDCGCVQAGCPNVGCPEINVGCNNCTATS